MLDGVSLDQLRTFIAAADEGVFSAPGRRLHRAQSVVSQTLANLEGQLGVKLFDRSRHLPVLTDQGRALLANARAVAGDVDLLKARAKNFAGGLEPELSVAVDVMFPDATFTHAVAAFQKEFPATLLRFDVESSAVIEPVLDGCCAIGVVGSWALIPPQLTHEVLLSVRVSMVVSPKHPLASRRGRIPTPVLAEHIQISHIDPSDMTDLLVASARSIQKFGASLTSAPSWLSCARAWVSEACPCIPSRRNSQAARSLKSHPITRRPGATLSTWWLSTGPTARRGRPAVDSSTASSKHRL